MRITCPNCQATYEVGDSDIPDDGIEVECSACLKRWMQLPVVAVPDLPDAPEESAEEPTLADVVLAESVSAESQVFDPQEGEAPPPAPDAVVMDFPSTAGKPGAAADTPPEPLSKHMTENRKELTDTGAIPDLPDPEGSGLEAPQAAKPVAPSTGWRVPKPPKGTILDEDPLDLILAEVSRDSGKGAPSLPDEAQPQEAPESAGAEMDEPAAALDNPEKTEGQPDAAEAADSETGEAADDEEAVQADVAQPDESEGVAEEAPAAPEEQTATVLPEAAEFEEEGSADLDAGAKATVADAVEPGADPKITDNAETAIEDEEPLATAPETPETNAETPEKANADGAPEPSPDAQADAGDSEALSGLADKEPDAAAGGPDAPFGFEVEADSMASGPSASEVPPVISEPSWPEVDVPEPVSPREDGEAPFAATAAVPGADIKAPTSEPDKSEDEAHREMNALIENLGAGAGAGALRPVPEKSEPRADDSALAAHDNDLKQADEDDVFHPWEGEVASEISEDEASESEAAATPQAATATQDDDDFEWVEPPAKPDGFNLEPSEPEDGSVEAEHMAALARQNSYDRHDETPDISNVIQANIQPQPFATMPSGRMRPPKATPHKPTPVDSQRDVEAAIREQIHSFKKPPVRAVVENEPVKKGLFGRKPKPADAPPPQPEPETPAPKATAGNALKDALLAADEDTDAPRSGKRSGFYLVLILFLSLLALYIWADLLAAQVPALESYLKLFTGFVDNLRVATQKLLADYLPARP